MKRMVSLDSLLNKNTSINILDKKMIKLNSSDKIDSNFSNIGKDKKILESKSNTNTNTNTNANINVLLTHNNYYSSKYRTFTDNEQRKDKEDFIFCDYTNSNTLEKLHGETKNYKSRKYSKRLYGSLNLFNEGDVNVINSNENSRNFSLKKLHKNEFKDNNNYDIVFHKPKFEIRRSNTSFSKTSENFKTVNTSDKLCKKTKNDLKQNFNINGIYKDPLILKSSKK